MEEKNILHEKVGFWEGILIGSIFTFCITWLFFFIVIRMGWFSEYRENITNIFHFSIPIIWFFFGNKISKLRQKISLFS